MNAAIAPPTNAKAAPKDGNAESMRHKTYNVRPVSASFYLPQWLNEEKRLEAEARRTGKEHDRLALLRHRSGIIYRLLVKGEE